MRPPNEERGPAAHEAPPEPTSPALSEGRPEDSATEAGREDTIDAAREMLADPSALAEALTRLDFVRTADGQVGIAGRAADTPDATLDLAQDILGLGAALDPDGWARIAKVVDAAEPNADGHRVVPLRDVVMVLGALGELGAAPAGAPA